MPARFQSLAVQVLVLLHVRERDHEIERLTGEELIDVRIPMGNLELFGALFRSFRFDVADAYDLDVGTFGENGQVLTRNAAAADHSRANPFWRLGCGENPGGGGCTGE